ncbi:helix-turn-helix transcriptional regulator [Rhizobium hidalgonense]|uniref:Helix-turn-helix transcriptional regulator n=1 Tax=Rhizobium hidalgonense TaxID=1538159 RepID=A0AAJ2GSS5_9HYPH|nr:helix-turn-helix transcriptional regulator [Rhizobium hidalgonense]MDR9772419.1 helix-turn-helix transcriptional regulator [Rhizobium hidalgonense]
MLTNIVTPPSATIGTICAYVGTYCAWTGCEVPAHFSSMEPLATNLRKQARLLGLSNAEVARRAGLTDRRYGNYVTGDREPDLATLLRICEALQTTPNDLLGIRQATDQDAVGKQLRRLLEIAGAMRPGDLQLLIIQAEAIVAARAADAG